MSNGNKLGAQSEKRFWGFPGSPESPESQGYPVFQGSSWSAESLVYTRDIRYLIAPRIPQGQGHKQIIENRLKIFKFESWRSLLAGFWGFKNLLEPLGVPSWLQDPKKHTQDQWWSNFWVDFGSILGPKMAPKSIKNRSKNWSKCDWFLVTKKCQFGFPKPPNMEPKIDKNCHKIGFAENMKIIQKCRNVAHFKGSGGPKMSYFWYFQPSKMGSKIRSNFGSIFYRFWLDLGTHFDTQNW